MGIRSEDEVEYTCTAPHSPSLRRGKPMIGSAEAQKAKCRAEEAGRRKATKRPKQDSYTSVA